MQSKLTILLVDDEPLVGKRLRPSLEKCGYEVETCEDGAAALQLLTERSFDVVVTDIRMGEVGGMEVLSAAQAKSAGVKVIIITGYASAELAREALAKGAFDVLAKPFRPDDLRKILARAAKTSVSSARSDV